MKVIPGIHMCNLNSPCNVGTRAVGGGAAAQAVRVPRESRAFCRTVRTEEVGQATYRTSLAHVCRQTSTRTEATACVNMVRFCLPLSCNHHLTQNNGLNE